MADKHRHQRPHPRNNSNPNPNQRPNPNPNQPGQQQQQQGQRHGPKGGGGHHWHRRPHGHGRPQGGPPQGQPNLGPGEPQDLRNINTATLEKLDGVIEVLPEGYGFLRSRKRNYLPGPEDIYVPTSLVRRVGMRPGTLITGGVSPPRKDGQKPMLATVDSLDGMTVEDYQKLPNFADLISLDPVERIRLETPDGDLSMRVMDLFTPIGKGQRGLIVSPPRSGKTMLLQKIANSITTNHPEIYLMVLLINERPEEVTDMRRTVKGEVISSSLDELSENHVKVGEVVQERAKRLVEMGKDVVILLDSLTRLGRAHNIEQQHSGRTLSGGLDARSLEKPKQFFGSARKAENAGSLTIIASALIDTGSRMDQVIFEEFKGTGNMELVLSRELAERRIFPAIDLNASGTRKEEKLLEADTLSKVYLLRRVLAKMKPVEAMELLLDKMGRTKSNKDFLKLLVASRME
ncbi:MAG: transcription termination factor Rho [Planctomycetes bacterium]|nr:transcription termination factor Rho [Planctomycetota bacterium]MBI3846930.1 transcription termination factor Rho [Planctomycetota bacterium]